MSENSKTPAKPATRVVHSGRIDPDSPFVMPPVVHASTVLFRDSAQISGRSPDKPQWTYGRRGTPTSSSLETAIAELEGAEGCVLTPSGASACDVALMSVLSAGDHLLLIDSVYGPTRNFCEGILARFGVETSYFDPLIGAGIEALIRPNTKAIFLEAPGSLTFEMPDVPAIAKVARARDIVSLIDNTWATPLYFRPLEHGVDVSIMAATKYVVGHSDALVGTIAAGPRAWKKIKTTHGDLGMFTGPDDMYLAMRGLKTMAVRLAHQQKSALAIAQWLETRPEVTRVLHPALPSDPGHAIWKRDFDGASGLFGFVLKPASQAATDAFLDGLDWFGLGFSWGGFESLATAPDPRHVRTATTWSDPGQLIRLQIGLEDTDDLIADLAAGLDRYAAIG